MYEKEAENYAKEWGTPTDDSYACCRQGFIDGAEYGYKTANKDLAEAREIIRQIVIVSNLKIPGKDPMLPTSLFVRAENFLLR